MCFSINMIIRIFLCRYYLYLRGHERWFWYCCSSKRVASRIYVTHVQIAFCIKPMRVVVTPLISRNPAKEVVEFLSGMPSEELSSCLYFCDIQGNTFDSGRGPGGVFLNQTLGRWTVSMLFPSSPPSPNDNNDLVTYSYRGRWNLGERWANSWKTIAIRRTNKRARQKSNIYGTNRRKNDPVIWMSMINKRRRPKHGLNMQIVCEVNWRIMNKKWFAIKINRLRMRSCFIWAVANANFLNWPHSEPLFLHNSQRMILIKRNYNAIFNPTVIFSQSPNYIWHNVFPSGP